MKGQFEPALFNMRTSCPPRFNYFGDDISAQDIHAYLKIVKS